MKPSALFCAVCGDMLWRDEANNLVHGRNDADHMVVPTGNPHDNAVAVPAKENHGRPELLSVLLSGLDEQRRHKCQSCRSVTIPFSHGVRCHGCDRRVIGPLTVQMLEGYGLAANS